MARVAIVGAGWAGASTAHSLVASGVDVEIFEKTSVSGGHSRFEVLGDVVYEPNGAHIFHTSDEQIATFVQRHGLTRPFEHVVSTEVYLTDEDDESVLLSWPPQIEELKNLPIWPQVSSELDLLPETAQGDDFESYVISMMGRTLYNIFIREYTIKQWGVDPSELSSRFAPKRVELRTDGYRRLFRDRWEFFNADGINAVIESVIAGIPLHVDTEISIHDLEDLERTFDAVVITAPLDTFADRAGELAWRGISMKSELISVDSPSGTVTKGYVINHPSARVPYTRTVETKHATGQSINATVVSEEYPGAPHRHYPVATPDGRYERLNAKLQQEILASTGLPLYFCGRLANYLYINQDEAIRQGFDCADAILEDLTP
ncbi:MAG: UDP-galactopyranose mutase [Acidimicrobiia bacterium]